MASEPFTINVTRGPLGQEVYNIQLRETDADQLEETLTAVYHRLKGNVKDFKFQVTSRVGGRDDFEFANRNQRTRHLLQGHRDLGHVLCVEYLNAIGNLIESAGDVPLDQLRLIVTVFPRPLRGNCLFDVSASALKRKYKAPQKAVTIVGDLCLPKCIAVALSFPKCVEHLESILGEALPINVIEGIKEVERKKRRAYQREYAIKLSEIAQVPMKQLIEAVDPEIVALHDPSTQLWKDVYGDVWLNSHYDSNDVLTFANALQIEINICEFIHGEAKYLGKISHPEPKSVIYIAYLKEEQHYGFAIP